MMTVASQVASVLRVGSGIDRRDRKKVQPGVRVDESEDTSVAKGGHFPVTANAGNSCFNSDRGIASIGYAADEVQLVTHSDGLVEVNTVSCDQNGAGIRDHFRAYMSVHVRAMCHVTAEDLLGDVFVFRISSFPSARDEIAGQNSGSRSFIKTPVQLIEESKFLQSGFGGFKLPAGVTALLSALGTPPVTGGNIFERRQRDASLTVAIFDAGDHGEVART